MTGFVCPIPAGGTEDVVQLAHGEGGRLMRDLLQDVILPPLHNELLLQGHDGCVLPPFSGPAVFTTDSYVVTPLSFPGGDIGSLAVYGTANDLAVSGARPRWISLGLILEEGLPLSMLRQVMDSIRHSAELAGVQVVTGDTKVVPRGAADGMFINTSGIGELIMPCPQATRIETGDALLVTGPIARHGMAILASREQLEVDPRPTSDTASLFPAVDALHRAGIQIHALRDCTRGGMAAVLREWADACGRSMLLESQQIPVLPETRGLCELLGLDPLHIACEGTMAVALPAGQVAAALQVLRSVPVASGAVLVGEVIPQRLAPVVIRRALGQLIPLDEPLGAPLPRIC